MHTYRSHTCNELRSSHVGSVVRLAGWVHRKRDHGQLLFLDLRDHYGITQCVIDVDSPVFSAANALRLESVVRVNGTVVARTPETVNKELETGEIELRLESLDVLSEAEPLPFPVNAEHDYPEDMRLTYRFLDLRREALHKTIVLRSRVRRSVVRPDIGTGVDPPVVFRPALRGRRRLHEAGVGPAREGREQPDEQHSRRGAAGPWKELGR